LSVSAFLIVLAGCAAVLQTEERARGNDPAGAGRDPTAFHHNDTSDAAMCGSPHDNCLFASDGHFWHRELISGTPDDTGFWAIDISPSQVSSNSGTGSLVMTYHRDSSADSTVTRFDGSGGWLEHYEKKGGHGSQRTSLYWDGGENLDTAGRQKGDSLRNPARRAYWGFAWCDRSLNGAAGYAHIAQCESSQARIMADTLEQAEMVLLGSHSSRWSDTTSATAATGFYTDMNLTARGAFTLGRITIDSISKTPDKDTMFFWSEGRQYILPAKVR
jgi:hypothetical protein